MLSLICGSLSQVGNAGVGSLTLTAGAAVSPFSVPTPAGTPAVPTGTPTYSTIDKTDGYESISCYTYATGIYCQLIDRSRNSDNPTSPGPVGTNYHADLPRSGNTYIQVPSYTGSEADINVVKIVDVPAGTTPRPGVARFDQRNAIVCYTISGLQCVALKIYGQKLTVGTPVTVHSAASLTQQFDVVAFKGGGAPVDWAARRALVCYSVFDPASLRYASCNTISLSFPMYTSSGSDGHVAGQQYEDGGGWTTGTLTVNAATPIESVAAPYGNEPPIRINAMKSLTSFDYFNAMLCYERPFFMQRCANVANCPGYQWAFGSGVCRIIQADVATATMLTVGPTASVPRNRAPSVFPGGPSSPTFITELSTEAFQPKTGDPTRALVCAITLSTYDPDGPDAYDYTCQENQAMNCYVAQRTGLTVTFVNQQRNTAGEMPADMSMSYDGTPQSSGQAIPSVAIPIITGVAGTAPKDLTITTLDEYNAVVCFTISAAGRRQAPYPIGDCVGAGNGLELLPGSGTPQCSAVVIKGYSNTDYAAGATTIARNIATVSTIEAGAPIAINSAAGSYPSMVTLKPHFAVFCYISTSPQCHLVTDDLLTRIWHFSTEADCESGYHCDRLRVGRSLREKLALAHEQAGDGNVTAVEEKA